MYLTIYKYRDTYIIHIYAYNICIFNEIYTITSKIQS